MLGRQSEAVPAVNADQCPVMRVAVGQLTGKGSQVPNSRENLCAGLGNGLRAAVSCGPKPTWVEAEARNSDTCTQCSTQRDKRGVSRSAAPLSALERAMYRSNELPTPKSHSSILQTHMLAFT